MTKRRGKRAPQKHARSADEADQRMQTATVDLSISVDTVARVALHFLNEQGDEQRARRKQVPKDVWPEITAIRDAVDFLDRCASWLSAYGVGKQRRERDAELLAEAGFDPEAKVPFAEAVKFVTSESRLSRAEQYYSEYVRQECGPTAQRDAAVHIELRRTNGIDARYMIAEERAYQEMLRIGALRRRGGSRK